MDLLNLLNKSSNDLIIQQDNKIIIMLEILGKHKNTYIFRWNIDINEKKEHLKILKKKNGCNGSIKIFNGEDNVIHLQGDQCSLINKYLLSIGINEDDIELKN